MVPPKCYSSEKKFENCQYFVSWKYSATRRDLTITIYQKNNNAWTGIGFSADRLMTNTDIISGWISKSGSPLVQDRFAFQRLPVKDARQNISNVRGASLDGGGYILSFRRRLRTDDSADVNLSSSNCYYLVYPVAGGVVISDQREIIGYHYETPIVSDRKYCFKQCLNRR